MIGALIGIILLVIVLGIICWAVQQLLPLIPMGEPFRTILRVLFVVLIAFVAIYIVVILLEAAGIMIPHFGRL